jgi:hypothetical protein
VVLGIFGASAGLGGLSLVFLGLLVSGHQSVAPKAVKERTRNAAWAVFAAFALNMVSVAAALIWLVIPGGDVLYWAVVGLFSTGLIFIVAVAGYSTGRLLR